jgi:hypothetical protein
MANDIRMTEAGACAERVGGVLVEGVLGVDDGGDAALGPIGRGVARLALGHDRDLAHLGRAQGVVEAREPRSDHEEVELAGLTGCGRGLGVALEDPGLAHGRERFSIEITLRHVVPWRGGIHGPVLARVIRGALAMAARSRLRSAA